MLDSLRLRWKLCPQCQNWFLERLVHSDCGIDHETVHFRPIILVEDTDSIELTFDPGGHPIFHSLPDEPRAETVFDLFFGFMEVVEYLFILFCIATIDVDFGTAKSSCGNEIQRNSARAQGNTEPGVRSWADVLA